MTNELEKLQRKGTRPTCPHCQATVLSTSQPERMGMRADILDALDFLESAATLKENHFNVPEINQHNSLIAEKAETIRLALFSVAATPAVGGEAVAWRIYCTTNGATGYLYTERLPFDPGPGVRIRREPEPLYAAPPASPLRPTDNSGAK